MASGEVRKVSREDIQLVQNLIERCLQLYMSQKEVVDVLLQQAKIEPGFTELVWNRLEVENQEFFRAYHLRLIVKDQILRFNELLERQDQLMHQICSSEFASIAISDGSQIPSVPQNTVSHSPEHIESPVKMEAVDQDFNTNLHNAYIVVSSLQPCTPAMDLTSHARRIEAPSNITFAQNSNVGMIQGMNVEMLKPEGVYTGNNAVVISADVNGLDTRPAIENAPIASYNGIMPKSQTLNQTFLDIETPAFGSLGQIPRNFSLSDLTADFSSSNEILESFSRSIFVASDHDGREGLQGQHHDNFMDPHGREGLRGQHHDNFMDPHGREGLRGQHHDMKHHDNFMDPHGREGLRGQHRDNFMDPNLRGGRQGQHDDNFMDRHRR